MYTAVSVLPSQPCCQLSQVCPESSSLQQPRPDLAYTLPFASHAGFRRPLPLHFVPAGLFARPHSPETALHVATEQVLLLAGHSLAMPLQTPLRQRSLVVQAFKSSQIAMFFRPVQLLGGVGGVCSSATTGNSDSHWWELQATRSTASAAYPVYQERGL